jgi:hypothetical protein
MNGFSIPADWKYESLIQLRSVVQAVARTIIISGLLLSKHYAGPRLRVLCEIISASYDLFILLHRLMVDVLFFGDDPS